MFLVFFNVCALLFKLEQKSVKAANILNVKGCCGDVDSSALSGAEAAELTLPGHVNIGR